MSIGITIGIHNLCWLLIPLLAFSLINYFLYIGCLFSKNQQIKQASLNNWSKTHFSNQS